MNHITPHPVAIEAEPAAGGTGPCHAMDDWAIATAADAAVRTTRSTSGAPTSPDARLVPAPIRLHRNILRHPHGPDGTAGFHAGRARRGLPHNAAHTNDGAARISSAGTAMDPAPGAGAPSGFALDELPDELLAAVLCQLDSETLVCAVPLVCRRWRSVCATLTVGLDIGAWSTWSPGYWHFSKCSDADFEAAVAGRVRRLAGLRLYGNFDIIFDSL